MAHFFSYSLSKQYLINCWLAFSISGNANANSTALKQIQVKLFV